MPSPQLHISASLEEKRKEKKIVEEEKPASLFDRLNNWVIMSSSVKIKDKVLFYRLLATMINAGISIIKALKILIGQIENQKLKKITAQILSLVEQGESLSDALIYYPEVFEESEIGIITAGEASGQLNKVLLQLAARMEKNANLNSKIKGALIYPVVIILIMIAATIVIMVLVIPKISELFTTAKVELPILTKVLIGTSNFFISYTLGIPNWLLLILALGILGFSVKILIKTPKGHYVWDYLMLCMPIFGSLQKKVALTKFCRGLGSLISSGVSIIKTLKITADSVGNEVYRKRIYQISDDVKRGITVADNINDEPFLFPNMVVSMIAVGEKTAQLHTITDKIADFYEEEVDTMVANLSKLMEPLIIVIIGVGVGILVAAIMIPIMQIADVASKT